jgi:mannosyl-oligosaccharide alpha-1,2-mannosidase
MAISNYISKLTRKPRLFFLVLCVIVILGQVYLLTVSSSSSSTTTKQQPNNNLVIPLNEERQQRARNQTNVQVVLDKPIVKTPPPPPPVKQSPLLGFGGFLSKLPQIQHNFSPEPKDYTQLREKRRMAVKKSFLHGWNGYSKCISQ